MKTNSTPTKAKKKSGRYWSKEIILSIITLRALKYICRLFAYRIVNCEYGHRKAKVGKNTNIHPTVIIREPQNVEIGSNCYFNHNTIMIGGHSDGKLIIGNYVQTGPNVGFYVANHNYNDRNTPIINQGHIENNIIIEDDVWIGANSVITSGVTIGKGSIIGAGSVVTKDIPSYSIAFGSPAKVKKIRE